MTKTKGNSVMSERSRQVLRREMILDLHYRLRLADDLFCDAAESLVSAAALETWSSRSEALRKIGEYSQALRVIHQDHCRITEGRRAVFPAELAEWVFELPEGEVSARLHLERLRAIAAGLELALNRELLRMEFSHE